MLANFVQETANAPGTAATLNLGGAVAGRVGFAAAFASGVTLFYALDDGSQGEWGIATLTHGSPHTLTRSTVLGNTAGSTARLNFTGLTRVYATLPAERAVWRDASNNLTLPGTTLALSPIGGATLQINAGTALYPGYVGFFTAEGTRRGYLGWSDGTSNLLLASENGWGWKATGSFVVAGALTAAGGAALDGAAGLARALAWQSAGSLRWQAAADSSAESGSNVGSNFSFAAYSDAGALLGAVYTVARASRVLDFKQTPTVNGLLAGATPNRQVFVASGSWTRPIGYPDDTLVLLECWGGGGGGSTSSTAAGGGGGGAYHQRLLRLGDLGASETVTVGSPAPAVAAVASTVPAVAPPAGGRSPRPPTTTSAAPRAGRASPTSMGPPPPIPAGPPMAAGAAAGTAAPAGAPPGAAEAAAAAPRPAAPPSMVAMAAPVEPTTRRHPAGAAAAVNQGRAAKSA